MTTIRNKLFDTSVFAPAVKGGIGIDSGIDNMLGLGTNNWDISLFKN